MSDTKDKLDDALFQLEQMRTHQDNTIGFRSALGAFLAHARSVDYFARSELASQPGTLATYKADWDAVQENPIVPFLIQQRHRMIHRELGRKPTAPPETHQHITANFKDFQTLADNISLTLIHADGTIGPTQTIPPTEPLPQRESESSTEYAWYFDDWPENMDIVTLCESYLHVLTDLVSRYEPSLCRDVGEETMSTLD